MFVQLLVCPVSAGLCAEHGAAVHYATSGPTSAGRLPSPTHLSDRRGS